MIICQSFGWTPDSEASAKHYSFVEFVYLEDEMIGWIGGYTVDGAVYAYWGDPRGDVPTMYFQSLQEARDFMQSRPRMTRADVVEAYKERRDEGVLSN